jgi:ribosomal protein S8E
MAAQTLTINGTNFLSTSTVTYNAVTHAATFVNSTQLTIPLTASDQATAGTYAVVVTNPAPGGGASNSVNFTVTATNPVPTITSLSPASAAAGAAAQTLTINGTNFLSASTVTYNAAAHAATFVSSTQLTISLSASDQATAGTYAVVVTNPAPGGGASNSVNFTVTATNPVPTITSLSPDFAPVGAAAQTLYIIGTGFVSTSTVTYNGAAHPATFVSTSELTIQLTASDQATAGTYAVVVTNPAPGGGTSNEVNFSVVHWMGLSWTASATPPAVVGYNVFRNANSGSSGPPWVQLNTTPITCTTTTCSFTDTNNGAGLSSGVEYWYVVTAVGSDGVTQSADSNVVTATIP